MPLAAQLAIVVGALTGLGLALVIRQLLPAHPHLGDALQRLNTQRIIAPAAAGHGLQSRVGYALQSRVGALPGFRVPARDLSLLRIPTHEWLGEKALLGLLGLAFPPAFALLMGFLGLGLPLVFPVAGSVLLGGLLFMVPSLTVRERAGRAREEMARAVGAYIELVALERLGGVGTTQSLENAASVGESWAILRIREELVRSRLSGVTPWQNFTALADELGVRELEDLADIMRLAGEEGAQIYDALRARGRGLRTQMLTMEQARANATSESMVVPVAMCALVFIVILAAPAIIRIL